MTDEKPDLGVALQGDGVETGDGGDALSFVQDYFPDGEEIEGKGRLSREMPVLLASLEQLPTLYPEVFGSDLESVLDEWIESLEIRQTSVEGESREEFKEILQSLFSGSVPEGGQGSEVGALMGAFVADDAKNQD